MEEFITSILKIFFFGGVLYFYGLIQFAAMQHHKSEWKTYLYYSCICSIVFLAINGAIFKS